MSKFTYLATPYTVSTATPLFSRTDTLRLVFDIEANNLLDQATKIHCIAIADLDSDQIDAYGPEQIVAALDHLARADSLVGHNISGYDLPLLRRLRDWAPAPGCTIMDTLIASRLILPHIDDLDDQAAGMGDPKLGKLRGRYSLEAWGARLGIPKIGADIEDWSAWTPEMQQRCAGDVAICKALYLLLKPDGYSQQAMELEQRTAAICNRITTDGVPFDSKAAEQLRQQWTKRRTELEAQLSQQFPGTKLSSRKQIGALLEARGWVPGKRTEKTGQPKIDDELLETIPALYPEFAGLAEYMLLERRLASLVDGDKAWLKHIGEDGRIHGAIVHIGTPHSRAAHFNPNLAQVPNPKRGKPLAVECRALFHHHDDWIFVTCDQAGLQDRCFSHYLAAFDGGDYGRSFISGADTHWKSATALGLVSSERDKASKLHTTLREGSKSFRYGFLFGMRGKRAGEILTNTIRAARQVDPSYRGPSTNGSQALQQFEAATPGLRQLRLILEAQAARNGWVLGLDERRVPTGAQYKALNRIVTSAEAIVCKRWLIRVHDELSARFHYGWDGNAVIVAWVHDELVVCCRPEIAEEVGAIMVRHAKEPGEFYGLKVPLDAEFKIGNSWAGDDELHNGVKVAETLLAGHPDSGNPEITHPRPSVSVEPEADHSATVENSKNGGNSGAGGNDDGGSSKSSNYHDGADDKDAAKPYPPVRAALLAKGYRVTQTFPFTVPGVTEPLFYEDRYELNSGLTPNKQRPQKTSRYWHRENGEERCDTGPRRIVYNWPAIMQAGPGAIVYITEGASKSMPLNDAELLATAAPYHQWCEECIRALAGDHLIYLSDHNPPNGNDPGPRFAEEARKKLAPRAASFRIVPAEHLWKHLPSGVRTIEQGDDVKDWIKLGGDLTKLLDICREIPPEGDFSTVPLTINEWLSRDLPSFDPLIGNVFSTTTRALLAAPTGIGKTNFGMALWGHAGLGRNFLHWHVPRPCRMLFIDGEMSRRLLRERIEALTQHLGGKPECTLFFNKEDIQDFAPLNTSEGQAAVWKLIEEVERRLGAPLDAIGFDNIVSLLIGDMKEEDAWRDTMSLVHALTKRRIGQLWLHHTGHDTSRGYGTKTREWQIDLVLHMTEVKRPDTDVSFTLEFPKARERTPFNRGDFANVNIALVDNQWIGETATTGKEKPAPLALRFFEALQAAARSSAITHISGYPTASLDEWQAQCVASSLIDPAAKPDAARSMFSKYKLQLIAANWIAANTDTAWILP